MNFQADANEHYRNEFINKHLLRYAKKQVYFFISNQFLRN